MPLTIDNPVLQRKNAHPRDKDIEFFDEGHRYVIKSDPDVTYTSVTTWTHIHFDHFDADSVIKNMMRGKNWKPGNKYWGMTPVQIKDMWAASGVESSNAGTNLHYQIECFMNCLEIEGVITYRMLLNEWGDREVKHASAEDWQYFLNYVEDNLDLVPYRTEMLVHCPYLQICGSVDMICQNPDGTLSIVDWKRCKEITPNMDWPKYSHTPEISHILDCKYWHYTLQLNMYRRIIETNYGFKVRDLTLVQIHPTNNNYVAIPLPILNTEMDALVDAWVHRNDPVQEVPQSPPSAQILQRGLPKGILDKYFKKKT